MQEADRVGISAMLPADAHLEVGPSRPAALHGDAYELPDALSVDRRERRAVDDLLLDVARDDPTLDVIAGEADSGLGEIVGAEREEVGVVGDAIGDKAGARKLDHRPDIEIGPVGEALLLGQDSTRARTNSSSPRRRPMGS